MQPFLITCETCHAQLKVTSAAAIGQILACPKCQSMVQIPAPEAATGTGENGPVRRAGERNQRSESGNPNPVGQGGSAEIPGGIPNSAAIPAASDDFGKNYFDKDDLGTNDLGTGDAALPDASNSTESTWPIGIPAEMASRRLVWHLLGGTALGLVVIAIVGIWWIQRPSQPPAQNQTPDIADSSAVVPSRNNRAASVAGNQGPDNGGSDTRSDPDPGSQRAANSAGSATNQVADGVESASDRPAMELQTDTVAGNRHVTEPPPEPPAEVPGDRPRDLPEASGQREISVADTERIDVDSERPTSIDGSGGVRDPVTDEAPNTAMAVHAQIAPPDPESVRPQGADAWNLSVARYQARRIPLATFLDDIAALAGAPVDLDLGSLTRVGATTRTPISIDAKEMTLLKILEETLDPIGLVPRVRPAYLVIESAGNNHPGQSVVAASRQAASTPAKRQSILDRPATFTFIEWTPLEDIRRDWQRIFGLTILIDWRALTEIGLQPTSRIQCAVIDRPIGESLTVILGELGMTWIVVDEYTIQITAHR